MPHIIVKLYKGRSEEMKQDMVANITKAVTESLAVDESSVSIALEEFEPEKWNEEVYQPDIIKKGHILYKKPGYVPKNSL